MLTVIPKSTTALAYQPSAATSLVSCYCSGLNHEGTRVDCDRLGGIVCLVDADQAVRQLKHVVAQADDNKLRVLGPLLDVVCHNAHVLEVCTAQNRVRG